MRTLGSTLRTVCMRSPRQLWCYCAEHLQSIWNGCLPRKHARAPQYAGMSPEQARLAWLNEKRTAAGLPPSNDMSSLISRDNLRVFGSLVYVRLEKERTSGKLAERWVKGIHLGFAQQSAGYRVGTMRPHEGRKSGMYLAVSEVKLHHIRFFEDVIVDDLDKLLPGSKEYEDIRPSDLDLPPPTE